MAKVLRLSNGVARGFQDGSSITIYDEYVTIGVGGLAANTAITLPLSQTYTADELEVYINGQRADVLIDFNYVGSAPRTQITITFALFEGEIIRFRIDRLA